MADTLPEASMDKAVNVFVDEGYRVARRAPDSALLVKPKGLSGTQLLVLGALVVGLSLLGGTGILLAILALLGFGAWFAAKRAPNLQLSLDKHGRIVLGGDVPRLPDDLQGAPRAPIPTPSGALLCPTCGRANAEGRTECTRCGQAFGAAPDERSEHGRAEEGKQHG